MRVGRTISLRTLPALHWARNWRRFAHSTSREPPTISEMRSMKSKAISKARMASIFLKALGGTNEIQLQGLQEYHARGFPRLRRLRSQARSHLRLQEHSRLPWYQRR